jgi:hypothetical protein
MELNIQVSLLLTALWVLIPRYVLPTPMQIGPMPLVVGLALLLVLSIAGERFYARHADAERMWRVRLMFVLAASVTTLALVIAVTRWL